MTKDRKKHQESDKECFLRRIEERREFAQETNRFSDVGFYDDLAEFISSKADEYQMVAAVLCTDVDIMHKVVNMAHNNPQRNFPKDFIYDSVCILKQKKDKLVNDKKSRELRYSACSALFNLRVSDE